ncbi:MAG: fibronectin type III domain-containing protein, partial [Kineosporiaceae bacterium]
GTNAIATGLPSAPSAAVTILGLPPVPTAVTATAGDASATVSWTAGAAVTGHPTTTFRVTATTGTTSTPVGGTANGTTTTLKVSGLTNGSAYTFTVVAVNDLGSSAPSAPSTPVTPRAPVGAPPPVPGPGPAPAPGPGAVAPAAPVLGNVTPGNGRLSLAWSAPANNGGSPVTGYAVRVFRGTGTTPLRTLSVPATPTTLTVRGLANGTRYSVDVAAVNAVGTGAPSARSASVTPRTVPARVTGVRVKRGKGSLTVSWKAPANGGSAITRYTISAYVGHSTKAAKVATVKAGFLVGTLTGLRNGTGYTVDVRAVNAAGTGAASARSAVVVPGPARAR